MAIKVGFSTSVCPAWDIQQIVTRANEMGFYGVELGAVREEVHLPDAKDLQTDEDIDAVRKLFADNNVELVSLDSKYSFDSHLKPILRKCFARTVENIELAGKLGCPYVRISLGAPRSAEPANATLARQVGPLADLARIAVRHHVTLLVCNTAGYPGSRSVWSVVDGVSHPGLGCAWDPMLGLSADEGSTLAVPRLGARLKMVQTSDAGYDGRGQFLGYRPVGKGSVDYGLTIDLLKGVLFDGYLMLDWPKGRVDGLPEPAEALPEALAFLLERIKHTHPGLSAYKKDKNAPNWEGAGPSFVERQVAGVAAAEVVGDAETNAP